MPLPKIKRQFLFRMGCPALGLAAAYTFVTTYLPYFINRLSSAAVTGLIIGVEAVFALVVPFIVGSWSDSTETRLGRRLPFIFAGVFLVSVILVAMSLSTHSLVLLASEVALFYIGYFTIFAGYFALFPDLVPMTEWGLSQGLQGGFRALGMLMALVSGGYLIVIWEPLPFIFFAVLLILAVVVLYYGIRSRIKKKNVIKVIDWYSEWGLVRHHKGIRLWVIANTFWEAAVCTLRVFVVLYFTRGLHLTLSQTSGALGLVGLSGVVAAPVAGVLADKYGHKPVILTAIVLFAVGLMPPLFFTMNKVFIAGIFLVSFSAVILMTLPFSVLMGYLPKEKRHAAGAALFCFCQGVGVLVAPVLAGFSVEIFKNFHFFTFSVTNGYSVIFLLASLFLFASVPFSIALFRVPAGLSETE